MEDPSGSTQASTTDNSCFSLRVFVMWTLMAGAVLLVFGGVFIMLIKFNFCLGHIIPPDLHPLPFAGGAIVLVALTLIGVPIIPAAAAAGIAIWWLFQGFSSKN